MPIMNSGSSDLQPNAYRSVFTGLIKKLPLFLVAAFAFFMLTGLDRSKTNYDLTNDVGSAASITINSTFLEDPDVKEWVKDAPSQLDSENRPYEWLGSPAILKYRYFSSQRMLLNALADTASAQYVKKLANLEALERDQQGRRDKASESLATLKIGTRAANQKAAEIRQVDQNLQDIKLRKETLGTDLQTQYVIIYDKFGPQLPGIVRRIQGRSEGFMDNLLKPVLNENSSLHIVFQVFRISALVIIILTFIFIFVSAIQLLPIASGSDTASDQLKSLISLKSSSASGGVVKAAIIGITALGVGTAVVVGGHALDTRTQGAASENSVALSGSLNQRGQNWFIGQNGPYPAHYYELAYFSKLITERLITQNQPITNEFNPNITVRPRVFLTSTTPDTTVTTQLLVELRNLVQKLPDSMEVSRLSGRIDSLLQTIQSLRNPADCDCKGEMELIRKSIDRIGDLIGKPPPPQTTSSPGTAPTSTSTPTSDSDTLIGNLRATTQALQKIENELKAGREAERLRHRPDGRNILNRTDDFIFGAQYYAVSERSIEDLKTKIKPNQGIEYERILAALEKMKTLPPQRKEQFLKSLRQAALESGFTVYRESDEEQILESTKLPN